MKIIQKILIFVLLATFISCENSIDFNDVETLDGKWRLSSISGWCTVLHVEEEVVWEIDTKDNTLSVVENDGPYLAPFVETGVYDIGIDNDVMEIEIQTIPYEFILEEDRFVLIGGEDVHKNLIEFIRN